MSENLPIRIAAKDVEANPELKKLLIALSHHIAEDGHTKSVQQDMSEAENNLKREKYKWLQYSVLYDELQDLLLDQQLKQTESTPSGNAEFYKAVKECLTLAELGDYLKCSPDPNSATTLLGLKHEDIQRRNPHRKHMQSIQQKLIPEVEGRLRKKCEALVHFHEPATGPAGDSERFAFAKASQLPAVLETEQQSAREERKLLQKDRAQRDKQFWHYYQALMDSLKTLELLITRHRLQSQAESDHVTGEWLTARCDAMCLKIRMLEMQLLCDTYYMETVQALNTTKRHLDVAIYETKLELDQATQALKAYEAVGSEFDSLVQDYTNLRDEVENKRWALRELKTSIDKDVT